MNYILIMHLSLGISWGVMTVDDMNYNSEYVVLGQRSKI